MKDNRGENRRIRAWRLVLAGGLFATATAASAGDLYKCGKNFQDRPCEATDVQQRFSRAQGTFAIEQVNPNTDKDCAKVAGDAIGWWRRMQAGEPLEKLHGEIQELKISRYDKSVLRDVLTAVKNHTGKEREVRGEYETQCMAYKRKNGYPTEKDQADAPRRSGGSGGSEWSYRDEARRADAQARRAEADAQRVDAQNRAATAPPPVRPVRGQPY